MKSKLKKSELRQLIKEELNNFNENKEEGKGKNPIKIPAQLKSFIKELDPNINIQILSMGLAKIAKGKENSLSLKENEILSQVFIALMRNKNVSLGQKFLSISKQIK